jgi:predicted nicotinamide N-methyase
MPNDSVLIGRTIEMRSPNNPPSPPTGSPVEQPSSGDVPPLGQFKFWLDSSCLAGVRALVSSKAYAGKVVEIDYNSFCVHEIELNVDGRNACNTVTAHELLPHFISRLPRYTELHCRNMMRQLAIHIRTLHTHRVVHRDLNANNVCIIQVRRD